MPIPIEDTEAKRTRLRSTVPLLLAVLEPLQQIQVAGSQVIGGGYPSLPLPHQGYQADVYAVGKSAENITFSGRVGTTHYGVCTYLKRFAYEGLPCDPDLTPCAAISTNQSLVAPGVVDYWTNEEPAKNPLSIAWGAQFEPEYEKLGRVRGRDGSPEARDKNCAFWLQQGLRGAKWLIDRLQRETSVEILDAAAGILRQLDKAVLRLIADALDENPTPEVAEALIRGLRRSNLSQDAGDSYSRVRSLIEEYSQHSAPEVREASYETALKFRRPDAVRLLEQARGRESDTELIDVIGELLQELERSSRVRV